MSDANETESGDMHGHAHVATQAASRYLQQLCKHFGHKVDVTFDERAGTVLFSIGTCRLAATEDGLVISLDAADADRLQQLRDVVESHLLRFAFRESLIVAWRDGLPGGSMPAA